MKTQRIIALVKMQLTKLYREPANLFLMLLFPAMLTIIFGLAFGDMPSETPGLSQFHFMAPGLFSYACIFIIMTVAQSFSDDREQGLLKRINITPTTSGEFMGSHIISNTIIAMIQVAIVAVLLFALGYRPEGGVAGIVLAFILMAFLSICSVGFGLITATVSKSAGAATGISFIFIMPQMFFGTFIPLTDLTRIIAMFLPSYYVTDSLTIIFNGAALTDLSIWINLAVIASISVVIVIIGIQLFKKYGKA
ncbi:MAG: ABC transporter permease [Candidatus Lokiarchaeota archaeon]|nr:ABC transporter permease [Candidatus Lokiarchaeota archaeon]